MPKKNSKLSESKAIFKEKLPLFFSDSLAVTAVLKHDHVLQQRYAYDSKTGHFKCKEEKKFVDFASGNPEKKFYALLNPDDPNKDLTQTLSDSDLVKFYLIYCWAADFAHQHKLGSEWQTWFEAEMQEHIYEKTKQDLESLIFTQRSKWSKAKSKLYAQLLKNTEQLSSVEQKARYYHQMMEQIEHKHFYSDGSSQHVFSQYSELLAHYEYETLSQELTEALQPILYYPQTDQQQANICNFAKHCLFRDKDTKELKYINSTGTIFTLPSTFLLAKNANQIKMLNGRWQIEYKKSETSKKIEYFEVDKKKSEEFGEAFRLDAQMVSKLVPSDFPEDPIVKLANKTLKDTKHHYYTLQHTLSLFGQDHVVAIQHRMAGLVQIKEMLEGVTTREVHQTKVRPNGNDYIGRGRNTYIFFDNPEHRDQAELWHVDRSHDVPVLTQFPMDIYQANRIRFMFNGAQSGAPPRVGIDNIEECNEWYELGEKAQKIQGNTVLRLSPEAARNIPQLLLTDMEMYEYLITDRTYYETSNELTDVLENTEQTPENKRLIQRCRDIHSHLYLIEQDRLRAFPKSRGVVPPHIRQKMMQMMTSLVLDKNSPEARHYFRTEHRVYQADFQEENLDQYAPASFVWDDGQDKLYYLDEYKKKTEVTMTDSIRRKLTKVMAQPHAAQQVISANDVYELMTRPRLFYYYCGFPIGLDLRWFDFTYYIPLKFDRSKGLHTGTAQEMTREIHEQKLSVMNLLYKLGEAIIMLVIPLILASLGIDIPWEEFLGALQVTIIYWVLMVWNIEYTFDYLRFSFLMNDLTHPELNQLDKMLQELDEDVKNLPSLEYPGSGLENNLYHNDLLPPDARLSF